MNDLVRTVIIGFLSGIAGAAIVVAITNDESSTPPVATDSATQSRSPSDAEEQMLYDAMREAAAEARSLSRMSSTPDTFRDSLGDEKYEQYLEASGQSTAVTVRNLLQGSAADNAGIQLSRRWP